MVDAHKPAEGQRPQRSPAGAGGAFKGWIDQVMKEGNATRFGGWALLRRDRRPADRILAFAGGRLA